MADIDISVASYRDPELLPTIRSAWINARNPDELHFTVISQAENEEHPDLSFIPEDQITYHKFHWTESQGACWARYIGSSDIKGKYFLQVDSHSRFRPNWDSIITNTYDVSHNHYGDMVFTCYPEGYKILDNGEDELHYRDEIYKIIPFWNTVEKMIGPEFEIASNSPYGDEIHYLSANSLFCLADYMEQVPYDPLLYFYGEEPSMGLRFFTRDIKLINTPVNFMFHEYKATWKPEMPKRKLHWDDNPEWHILNRQSYERLAKIMTGQDVGIYGIGSDALYQKWIDETGIDLRTKYDEIMSWGK